MLKICGPCMFLLLCECNNSLNCCKWTHKHIYDSKYHQTYFCLLICDLSEVVASSPRGNLVGDSPIHFLSHLLSTATNLNTQYGLHFNSPGPNTHSPCARKPPGFPCFVLSSLPFLSLIVCLCELAFQSRESDYTTCSE